MKTIDEPIVVEQTFRAPISAVWKALTEIDQMRLWFFDCIPDFKAEVGFETKFTITNDDRVFPHQWKVTEVEPEKKLAYNWNYKGYTGDSFVVFELFKENDSTRLKLTHQVTESFPDDIPEFKRESGLAGWKYFIQKNLKEYLRVSEIESQIDQSFAKSVSLCGNGAQSIWYLVMAQEAMMCMNPAEFVLRSADSDDLRYALKYCLTVVYRSGQLENIFKTHKRANLKRHDQAMSALHKGIDYKGVWSAFVSWRRKWAKPLLVDNNTIRFVRNKEEIKYDFLSYREMERIGRRYYDKLEAVDLTAFHTHPLYEECIAALKLHDYNAFDAKLPVRYLQEVSDALPVEDEKYTSLPLDWKFKGVSIVSFRLVWRLLRMLSAMQRDLQKQYIKETNPDPKLMLPKLVHVTTRQKLSDRFKRYLPRISVRDIDIIINTLFLDPSDKIFDPSLQPFIALSKDLVITSPSLLVYNNLERNLMALLAKKSGDEYSAASSSYESHNMLILHEAFTRKGYKVRSGVRLPSPAPDIDVAIHDEQSNILFLIQHKATYEASEVTEVISKADECEAPAISQTVKTLNVFEKNPEDVWSRCFPDSNMPNGVSVKGLVIIRNFHGTHRNLHPNIPVIEQTQLIDQLQESHNSKELVDWLFNRHFLPQQGSDYESEQIPITFDQFTIYWEVFTVSST